MGVLDSYVFQCKTIITSDSDPLPHGRTTLDNRRNTRSGSAKLPRAHYSNRSSGPNQDGWGLGCSRSIRLKYQFSTNEYRSILWQMTMVTTSGNIRLRQHLTRYACVIRQDQMSPYKGACRDIGIIIYWRIILKLEPKFSCFTLIQIRHYVDLKLLIIRIFWWVCHYPKIM